MKLNNTSSRTGPRDARMGAWVRRDARVGKTWRAGLGGAVCPRAGADRSPLETPDLARDVLTFVDVRDRAKMAHNVTVTLSTFGPYFKLLCHHDGQADSGGGPVLLGETEGFIVAPLRILHVDSMRIYNSKMKKLNGGETGRLGMMGLGTFATGAEWTARSFCVMV